VSKTEEAVAPERSRRSQALIGNQRRAKPLVVEERDHGCKIVTSHALNSSGYPVKYYSRRDGTSHSRIIHREEYRLFHGIDEFPPDTDVDHLCGNRACINVNHLQAIDHNEHRLLTNSHTQSELESVAKLVSRWTLCDAATLADNLPGLGSQRASSWIEKWQSEALPRMSNFDTQGIESD